MKKWYTSKTLWVAFVVFGLSAAKAGGVNVPVLTEDSATMGIILSVIQTILRLVTKSEVVIADE